LQEDILGKDPSTFFTFDFYMHDTQATPVLASSTPHYDTTVQYVVDADTFLMAYLDTHVMDLELNRCVVDALGCNLATAYNCNAATAY
jgi:hypothetical protein